MDRAEIGKFIDAVVDEPARAEEVLKASPGLLDARWIHDETVLHFLVVEGFLDGVRWMIAHGAAVDAVNAFGDTALIDSVVLGNLAMARVLLAAGANPNAPSRSNENALMAAVTSGRPMWASPWGRARTSPCRALG